MKTPGEGSQGTRLQERPVLPTTRSWTSSLRNCEKRNFCCLSCSVGGTLLRQLSLPRPCKLTPAVPAEARPAHEAQAPSLPARLLHSLASSVTAVSAGRAALPTHLLAPQLTNAIPGKPGGLCTLQPVSQNSAQATSRELTPQFWAAPPIAPNPLHYSNSPTNECHFDITETAN